MFSSCSIFLIPSKVTLKAYSSFGTFIWQFEASIEKLLVLFGAEIFMKKFNELNTAIRVFEERVAAELCLNLVIVFAVRVVEQGCSKSIDLIVFAIGYSLHHIPGSMFELQGRIVPPTKIERGLRVEL
jgi:hypothetical protein